MNRVLSIFCVLFLHIAINGNAQIDKYKGETFLFQDAKTKNAIVIHQDSSYYVNAPNKFKLLKHTKYPELISRYNTFHIKGKTYFTHNGCGPVLEWRNDSIVRIDNSFLHQNQYGASTFIYKNEIYYFGGYGLFTFKNLLTKYIFKSREWMSIQTFGEERPSLRRDANRILINNNIYIFGGLVENPDNFYYGQKLADTIVWKLDLNTMKWTKEGFFDSKYNSLEGYFNFQNGKKTYLLNKGSDNKLLEIDLVTNTINKYILPSVMNVKSFYFDELSQELVVLHFLSTSAETKIIRLKLKSIINNPIQSETFIKNQYTNPLIIIGIGLIAILLFIIVYKFKIKNMIFEYHSIIYDNTNNQLLFKGKAIDSFDNNELKIISYLTQNQTDYIALNSLNNLFEQEELTENYTSTTKRRENTLNTIITKLSLISGCKENEILLYRRNPNDKRMKEIKLKDHFIRMK
nr:hypothetical protein [uncultured Flavobacterium sp.]